MKRRDFLKTIAGVTALIVTPVNWASVLSGRPRTVEQLIAWCETQFKCAHGAPWMYVEPRPEVLEGVVLLTSKYEKLVKDFTPYFTYRLWSREQNLSDAEGVLVEKMLQTFERLLGYQDLPRGTEMYWRLAQRIELTRREKQELGDVVPATDVVEGEDGSFRTTGGELVVERTDPYRTIYRRVQFYTRTDLRTRIAIPALPKLGGEYWGSVDESALTVEI